MIAAGSPDRALERWAQELGCSAEELRSAMGEVGRLVFEHGPREQFELDLRTEAPEREAPSA
jgi:hypothetical protein